MGEARGAGDDEAVNVRAVEFGPDYAQWKGRLEAQAIVEGGPVGQLLEREVRWGPFFL